MKRTGFLAGLLLGMAGTAMGLEVGRPAPDFTGDATGEKEIALSSLRGRWVVLFFYPRSFTPGCTAQACSLRDGHAAIANLNAVVLGVSVDRIERQEEFKTEHRLPYDLIADTDGEIARKFGVLGITGRLARRVTFLIDPQGRVAAIVDRVRTAEHDRQVREELERLQAPARPPPA